MEHVGNEKLGELHHQRDHAEGQRSEAVGRIQLREDILAEILGEHNVRGDVLRERGRNALQRIVVREIGIHRFRQHLADLRGQAEGDGRVRLRGFAWNDPVVDLDDVAVAVVNGHVEDLGHGLLGRGLVRIGDAAEGAAQLPAQVVVVGVDVGRGPAAAGAVGVRRPLEGGHGVQRDRGAAAGGQLDREAVAAPAHVAVAAERLIQVEAAIALLVGEHDGRRDGIGGRPVGREVGVQQLHGVGDGRLHEADVDGGELGLLHAEHVGQIPALLRADAAIGGVIEARVDGGDGHVARAAGRALPVAVDGAAPSRQEAAVQTVEQAVERVHVEGLVVVCGRARRGRGGGRVFVDEGHVGAVFFGHLQAGDVPFVAIGLDDLQLVVLAVLGADVVGVGGADIVEHLHGPDHAHVLGRPPAAVELVVHARVEGHIVVAHAVGDQLQRHVGGPGAGHDLLHRDAELGQQVLRRQALDGTGDLDLEHGHQTHIAIVVGIGRDGVVDVVEGLAVRVLKLPLPVVQGPVEHVLGIAQMVGVGGRNLELDLDQFVVCQLIDLQGEGGVRGKRLRVRGHARLGGEIGRQIQVVAHAVAVVVVVPDVGRAVAVGIGQRRVAGAHVPLFAVGQTVIVGILLQGIGVPDLVAAGHLAAGDFDVVVEPVLVRVFDVGQGAEQAFGEVDDGVAVGVAIGRVGTERVEVGAAVVGRAGGLLFQSGRRGHGIRPGIDGLGRGRGGHARHSLLRTGLLPAQLVLRDAVRIDALVEQERDRQHGDDDTAGHGNVDEPCAPVSHHEGEGEEAQRQRAELKYTVRHVAAPPGRTGDDPACAEPGRCGGGREVEEVDRAFGGRLVAVRAGREGEEEALAQGQAVVTHPELAVAGHGGVGLRKFDAHRGREPRSDGLLRKLGLHGLGEMTAVDIKGVAGHVDIVARAGQAFRSVTHDIRRRLGVGQKIAVGREETGEVVDLLPGAVRPARLGCVACDAHLQRRCRFEHAAAIGPDRKMKRLRGRVGRALQVETVLFAGAPGVGDRRRGGGRLDDVGAEAIGARLLHALPDRGQVRSSRVLRVHRVGQARNGQAKTQAHHDQGELRCSVAHVGFLIRQWRTGYGAPGPSIACCADATSSFQSSMCVPSTLR